MFLIQLQYLVTNRCTRKIFGIKKKVLYYTLKNNNKNILYKV